MQSEQVRRIRSFNRLVTRSAGALEQSYLRRGRPLGEARLIFEVGAAGSDTLALRERLRLDSGYLSRLLRSLQSQGLVDVRRQVADGRRRSVTLTRKGSAELAAYDRLSDRLAELILEALDEERRERLVTAMGEVERLLTAAAIEISFEAPSSGDARACLNQYFRELTARFETGFDPDADGSAPDDELLPPQGAFVVARLDGIPIGCGGLKRVDQTTGEIKRVWTCASMRGLGVARRVLRTLEMTARDRGIVTLRLDTNKALTEAHALYRKEGYREVARFNDNPYAHYWFEKRL